MDANDGWKLFNDMGSGSTVSKILGIIGIVIMVCVWFIFLYSFCKN